MSLRLPVGSNVGGFARLEIGALTRPSLCFSSSSRAAIEEPWQRTNAAASAVIEQTAM